jgi:ankyrin repeat protein
MPLAAEARRLFDAHLPCEEAQLRKVYLRLALKFHPDKSLPEDRDAATALFQAIHEVYMKLVKGTNGRLQIERRVKTPTSAAAELGDIEELEALLKADPKRAGEPDDYGTYPIHFAAKGGSVAALELLLRYGDNFFRSLALSRTCLRLFLFRSFLSNFLCDTIRTRGC